MLTAAFDALFGRVPFPTLITVLDVVLVIFFLASAGWTLVETRRLRTGSQTMTREKLAKHRRVLAVSGILLVIVGGVGVAFRIFDVGSSESNEVLRLFGALALLIWGVVCLWCRRVLDSPRRQTA
jgi:protein-S-isoprenylcysteine O-methyltransferase Ste14